MSNRRSQPPERPTGRPAPPAGAPVARSTVGRAVAFAIAGALVVAALSILLVAVAGRSPSVSISPIGVRIGEATPTTLPPEPRLESAPGVTAAFVRSREDPILTSYGWVDQKNGIARIPIQQAIDVLAQRGLPARPPNASSNASSNEGRTIPSYTSSGRYPVVLNH